MDLKKINSKEEYEQVLERIYELMDATPGSPEEEELDLLVTMADRYEEEQFPI
jgi:HTH-type transcriptional regulator/antitoxin HigA